MSYHYSQKVNLPFEEVVERLTGSLKKQGFGIITTINIKDTFREKLNIPFRNYRIIGACNPQFAYKAIVLEPQIGVMLPCNVVIQEHKEGDVEVSAINPMETMEGKSPELSAIASEVSDRLQLAVNEIAKEGADLKENYIL